MVSATFWSTRPLITRTRAVGRGAVVGANRSGDKQAQAGLARRTSSTATSGGGDHAWFIVISVDTVSQAIFSLR